MVVLITGYVLASRVVLENVVVGLEQVLSVLGLAVKL